MAEIYLAYILICGYGGNCKMFQDITGNSDALTSCHKKLDHMWERIKTNPKGVESTEVGKFSFIQNPRGFCMYPPQSEDPITAIHKRYTL
jgi:hypothetical protein